MSLIAGLGYVLVESPQGDAWRELANKLGVSAEDDFLRSGLRIRIDEWALRMLVQPGETERVVGIGWQVADRATFVQCTERLEKEGIDVRIGSRLEADQRGVTQVAMFSDPAGFPVEVAVGPHVDPVNRLITPHGARFVTGRYGLGHIVVEVDRYDEQIDFYTRVLGFAVRDSLAAMIRGAFLGCNTRHHSIAILETSKASRVDHVMIEVEDLDDVGRAYDRLVDGGGLKSSLGKWGPDGMISFYVDSPSGFAIELGFGGPDVDDDWCERQLGVPAGSVWGHKLFPAAGTSSVLPPTS